MIRPQRVALHQRQVLSQQPLPGGPAALRVPLPGPLLVRHLRQGDPQGPAQGDHVPPRGEQEGAEGERDRAAQQAAQRAREEILERNLRGGEKFVLSGKGTYVTGVFTLG
jgi:hypothetical protein